MILQAVHLVKRGIWGSGCPTMEQNTSESVRCTTGYFSKINLVTCGTKLSVFRGSKRNDPYDSYDPYYGFV